MASRRKDSGSLAWADRYLAIPFLDFGRSEDGCDCFGLYALVLARETGVMLPEVGVSCGQGPRAVIAKVASEIASGAWRRVDGEPQRFDLVQMKGYFRSGDELQRSDAVHIGCATGPGTVLHTEKPAGPKHQRLDENEIAHRIVGFWRPRLLDGWAA